MLYLIVSHHISIFFKTDSNSDQRQFISTEDLFGTLSQKLSDVLPTWSRLIHEAITNCNGCHHGTCTSNTKRTWPL